MIIYHQSHIGGFAGAHIRYWQTQPLGFQQVTRTSAAPLNELIEQARSIARFTFSRVFGRVN